MVAEETASTNSSKHAFFEKNRKFDLLSTHCDPVTLATKEETSRGVAMRVF